jgi:hypothetical protein
MTRDQVEELIAEAPALIAEALGELSDDIMRAAAQAYVASQETDSGKCKLSIPCKVVIDLAKSPPSYHAEASVSLSYKAASDEQTLDDASQPKLPGMDVKKGGAK